MPVLSHVVIVSKPSLRSYTRAKSVTQKERRNMSTLVISTNKGVMTGKDAKSKELEEKCFLKCGSTTINICQE